MNILREKAAAIAKRETYEGSLQHISLKKLLEENPLPHQQMAILNAYKAAKNAS